MELGIPEDDPRNPAVIADNVGDNVGDVAGMGADLYESYVGSVISTAALAVAAGLEFKGVTIPMALASVGILASILGFLPGEHPGGRLPEGTVNRTAPGNLGQRRDYRGGGLASDPHRPRPGLHRAYTPRCSPGWWPVS